MVTFSRHGSVEQATILHLQGALSSAGVKGLASHRKNPTKILSASGLPMLQFPLLLIALALIAVASSQFVAAGLTATRVRARFSRRRAHLLKNLRSAAEITRLESELQVSAGNQAGREWRVMEVAQLIDESADCRSYYLVDPYRQKLPEFHPGQHLLVRPATAGAFQATRCYSLSSSPDSRYWRITVKRQALQTRIEPTKNSGLSVWLDEHIRAGDCLLIGGPCGHFYLPSESQTEPLVLLAAGVGITPMASMLRWSMEHTPERPVVLLYQAKDINHWPLGTTLHQWLDEFPNCRVISYFSRLTNSDLHQSVPPNFDCRAGKFTVHDALQALPPANCRYYLCGPQGWMDNLRDGLVAAGVNSEHVHWESFGGDAPTLTTGEPGSALSLQVRFERSGIEAFWNTAGQSIWELAKANDVELPSGCLSGVCGSCRVRVLDGQVAYDRKIAIELAENECLACVAHPHSNLRIDA